MLKELDIDGFTLIANAQVQFEQGFTAITGETGAGKSVLLKALRMVCGDKAQTSFVRSGFEKAVVEARFDIAKLPRVKQILDELELDSDDELFIRREILESGKGRARVNGSVVSLIDLQKIGEELIQMHGQSEQLLLRDTKTHGAMLDEFAHNQNLLADYRDAFDKWASFKQKIKETELRAHELSAQKDFLKFQYDELSKANLKDGEEESLEEKISLASKGEFERRSIEEIQNLIQSDEGLLDKIQMLELKLQNLSAKLSIYENDYTAYSEVFEPFLAVCKDLTHLRASAAVSPVEIDKANARIAAIQKLKRKYRTDVQGLLALMEQRAQELSCLENLDADIEELLHQEKLAKKVLDALAEKLTESRKKAATNFDNEVGEILCKLGMPKAVFSTRIEETLPTNSGYDSVEFYLAPNPGEGEKTLQKAVSGGELSRVLLAIKSVMAELDQVPLLIFDEVDSGISGEVGNSIGEALAHLGAHHQILTITHLHQVASRAKNHLAVSKKEIEGRTFTSIKSLNENDRVLEIARMLGGDSEAILKHAKEILEESNCGRT